jgi:hypothetical protein
MMNCIRTVAISIALICVGSTWASHLEALPPKQSSNRTSVNPKPKPTLPVANPANITVTVALESGIGSYQDIQLPASTAPGFRADGRRIGIENTTHIGIPIKGSFEVASGSASQSLYAEANIMQIASLVAPAEVADSQYDRVEGNLGYRFGTVLGNAMQLKLIASAGYRQSRFHTISAGHYMTTFIPRVGAGLQFNREWSAAASVGVGIQPRFGYSDGEISRVFESSIADLTHYEGGIRYALDEAAAIAIGFELENSTVTISNTEEYSSLGLTVARDFNTERNYRLSTAVGFLRLEKRW